MCNEISTFKSFTDFMKLLEKFQRPFEIFVELLKLHYTSSVIWIKHKLHIPNNKQQAFHDIECIHVACSLAEFARTLTCVVVVITEGLIRPQYCERTFAHIQLASWRCGRASDLRSRGRGFYSRLGTRRKNLWQVLTKQYKLVLA